MQTFDSKKSEGYTLVFQCSSLILLVAFSILYTNHSGLVAAGLGLGALATKGESTPAISQRSAPPQITAAAPPKPTVVAAPKALPPPAAPVQATIPEHTL